MLLLRQVMLFLLSDLQARYLVITPTAIPTMLFPLSDLQARYLVITPTATHTILTMAMLFLLSDLQALQRSHDDPSSPFELEQLGTPRELL